MRKIEVEILMKPLSINAAYQGRRYRTPTYKKYQEDMHLLLPKKKMLEGQIGVLLTFRVKYPAMCDVDNFIKPILDIIVQKGYIYDDRRVYFLQAQKGKATEDSIKIEIFQL